MPRFPVSDHCDGELFFNPHACTDRTLRDLLRWWRTRTAVPWPTAVPVGTPGPLPGVPAGRVAATFIGLQDLRRLKQRAGRPQDLLDLEKLKSLATETRDE